MPYTPAHPCTSTLPCKISTCIFFEECDWSEFWVDKEEESA